MPNLDHLDARSLTAPGGAFQGLVDVVGSIVDGYARNQAQQRKDAREDILLQREWKRQEAADARAGAAFDSEQRLRALELLRAEHLTAELLRQHAAAPGAPAAPADGAADPDHTPDRLLDEAPLHVGVPLGGFHRSSPMPVYAVALDLAQAADPSAAAPDLVHSAPADPVAADPAAAPAAATAPPATAPVTPFWARINRIRQGMADETKRAAAAAAAAAPPAIPTVTVPGRQRTYDRAPLFQAIEDGDEAAVKEHSQRLLASTNERAFIANLSATDRKKFLEEMLSLHQDMAAAVKNNRKGKAGSLAALIRFMDDGLDSKPIVVAAPAR